MGTFCWGKTKPHFILFQNTLDCHFRKSGRVGRMGPRLFPVGAGFLHSESHLALWGSCSHPLGSLGYLLSRLWTDKSGKCSIWTPNANLEPPCDGRWVEEIGGPARWRPQQDGGRESLHRGVSGWNLLGTQRAAFRWPAWSTLGSGPGSLHHGLGCEDL